MHADLKGAAFTPLPEEYNRRGVESGVCVESVKRGSPAWENELRSEDVVTSVNRRPIESLDVFRRLVGQRLRAAAQHPARTARVLPGDQASNNVKGLHA